MLLRICRDERRGESLSDVHVGWMGLCVMCLGDSCGFKERVYVLGGRWVVLSGAGPAFPLDQLGRRLGKSCALGRGP